MVSYIQYCCSSRNSDHSTITFEVDVQVVYKKDYSKYSCNKGNYGAMIRDIDFELDLLLSYSEGDVKSLWQFVKQNHISDVIV